MLPSPGRVRRQLFAASCGVMAMTTPLAAQYPLSPTPVLPFNLFSPHPTFSGYVTARGTIRDDTATFTINRARLTLHVLPVRFAAVRVQVDFSGIGRTSGDTIPATLLTDAYVTLAPQDTSRRLIDLLRPSLVVGQFRTPFSLEYLTPSTRLPTVNRSQAVDRLGPRRDLGALGQLRFAHVATFTGAVVNGEGPNRTSNSNGKEMAIGRLTVFPLSSLAVSGKWLGHGADHRWGYDVRWATRGFIIEGEAIKRKGPVDSSTHLDGSGGYALVAYRLLPWLQPAVKWERLRQRTSGSIGGFEQRLTWITYATTLSAAEERLRFQLAWIARSERPVHANGELVAQLQAVF